MKLGIVGLPNVGKSTLFNALTNLEAASANYPFCTIDPNVGTTLVPDPRLDRLAEMFNPKKVTPAVLEFVDIAGLVKGASQGEGLGNKFLSHIRQVDVIVHVVRCFHDENIIHVDGAVDPARDIETINLELILSDIELLDRRIDKTAKMLKGDKKYQAEAELYERLRRHLDQGLSARLFDCPPEERALLDQLDLLSLKPVLYAANMDEGQLSHAQENPYYRQVLEIAERENSQVLPICARLEADIVSLEKDERLLFLSELGFEQSGLDRLITVSYSLLGLISFLTAGEDEVRAWTVTRGAKAPEAAGKIHSDIQRGFIRAEVVSYDDLMACGSMALVREKGLLRSEGRDYVMQDGDVVHFRFNV